MEKKIVLAVDDMPLNLRMIQKVLEPQFDVRSAKSAELARSVLTETKIDLILLDIELPGINGLDFLKELKAADATNSIPVIIVTSYSGSNVFSTAIRSGASDYIIKPYEPAALIEKINNVFK